ncbi:MAG: alpha-1,2-fucosyltransferase [Acetatifactor sp.]|nr:alpha-1,2-fucosyltransferase [Acetatifactor sp.]
MKIVKVKGGLGNQMFQYAFHRLLQEKYHCEDVRLDLKYYGEAGVDDIRLSRLGRMHTRFQAATDAELRKICLFKHEGNPLSRSYRIKVGLDAKLNKKYFFENNRAYRDVPGLLHYQYFDGYWQSWRYLEPIAGQLKQEFTCDTLSERTLEYRKLFSGMNSVFVGVRRGDYFDNEKLANHYGRTDVEYYKKAVAYMKEKLDNPVFVFFSNDMPWVKEYLNGEVLGLEADSIIYREEQDITDDFEELFVMRSCRNAIVTNSTFNFWGAWLMENSDKIVVTPKDWFKDGKPIDIIPDDWVRI